MSSSTSKDSGNEITTNVKLPFSLQPITTAASNNANCSSNGDAAGFGYGSNTSDKGGGGGSSFNGGGGSERDRHSSAGGTTTSSNVSSHHDQHTVMSHTHQQHNTKSAKKDGSSSGSGSGSSHQKPKKKFALFPSKKRSSSPTDAPMQISRPELVDHKGVSKDHAGMDPEEISQMIMKMINQDKFISTVNQGRYTTDEELEDNNNQRTSDESLDKSKTWSDGTSLDSSIDTTPTENGGGRGVPPPATITTSLDNITVKDTVATALPCGHTDSSAKTPENETKEVAPVPLPKPITAPSNVAGDKKVPRQVPVRRMTEEEMVDKLRELIGHDNPAQRFVDRQLIGSGASAKVYSCKDIKQTDQIVAMKILTLREQKKREYVVSEIRVMKKINHKNIVNLIDCFLTPDKKFLMIVMEFLWNALTNVILHLQAKMEETHIAFNSHEVLLGLQYLHQNNIIHRDIKSDNVLLGFDGAVKLADFGFCAELLNSDSQRKTQLGTPYWMSPEIARREQYSPNVDIWSLGILIIEMIDTSPPYMDDEYYARAPLQAIQEIAKLKTPPEIKRLDQISAQLAEFVNSCLTIDPSVRPDATRVLEHPFLNERCSQETFAAFIKKLDLED